MKYTAKKIKFSINNFFSKCDQIHKKLLILIHLLKKSLMESSIFCAVIIVNYMVMQIRCVKLLIGEGYFIKTESFLVETPLTAEISKISHFLK